MADQQQWQALYAFSLRTGIDLAKHKESDVGLDATSVTNTGFVNGFSTMHFVSTSLDTAGIYGFKSAAGTKLFALPLTSRPAWEQGQEQITSDKAIGESAPTAGTGYNFLRGITGPTGSVEFQATARGMIPFLWGLVQRGASSSLDTGVDTLTFVLPPATSPTPEVFVSALRRFSADSPDSQVLSDAVVTRFGFSSTEGEALQLSVDMLGRFLDNDFKAAETAFSGSSDQTHLAPDLGFLEENPLLHQNMDFIIQAGADSFVVTELASFDFTVTAEFIPKRYNSRFPVRYSIGGYTVEGSFSIPWGASLVGGNVLLEDLASTASSTNIDVTTTSLDFLWKTTRLVNDGVSKNAAALATARTLAAGDVNIRCGAVIQSVTVEGEDESMLNCSFIGVNIRSGNVVSAPAFGIYMKLTQAGTGYAIP
jgi:hypothetical protein